MVGGGCADWSSAMTRPGPLSTSMSSISNLRHFTFAKGAVEACVRFAQSRRKERLLFVKCACASMLAVALAFGAVSCSGQRAMTTPRQEASAVAVRLAPVPLDHFAVSAAFDGLPVALEGFSGVARYSVSNTECVPLDTTRAFGGVRLAPRHDVTLAWRRDADGVYRANAYLEALSDEDYFGLGLCDWRFDGLEVRFVAGGSVFVYGLAADDVRMQRARRGHYLVRDIGTQKTERAVFGEAADFYRPDLGAQFVLTLVAHREVVP